MKFKTSFFAAPFNFCKKVRRFFKKGHTSLYPKQRNVENSSNFFLQSDLFCIKFVEIMKMSIVPLTLYLMKYRAGKCTGINFIDSTTLDVCDTHRKLFENLLIII